MARSMLLWVLLKASSCSALVAPPQHATPAAAKQRAARAPVARRSAEFIDVASALAEPVATLNALGSAQRGNQSAWCLQGAVSLCAAWGGRVPEHAVEDLAKFGHWLVTAQAARSPSRSRRCRRRSTTSQHSRSPRYKARPTSRRPPRPPPRNRPSTRWAATSSRFSPRLCSWSRRPLRRAGNASGNAFSLKTARLRRGV